MIDDELEFIVIMRLRINYKYPIRPIARRSPGDGGVPRFVTAVSTHNKPRVLSPECSKRSLAIVLMLIVSQTAWINLCTGMGLIRDREDVLDEEEDGYQRVTDL